MKLQFSNPTQTHPKNELETIIDLVKENAELKRGLGDIILFLHCYQQGVYNTSMENSNEYVSSIFVTLNELLPKKELK